MKTQCPVVFAHNSKSFCWLGYLDPLLFSVNHPPQWRHHWTLLNDVYDCGMIVECYLNDLWTIFNGSLTDFRTIFECCCEWSDCDIGWAVSIFETPWFSTAPYPFGHSLLTVLKIVILNWIILSGTKITRQLPINASLMLPEIRPPRCRIFTSLWSDRS